MNRLTTFSVLAILSTSIAASCYGQFATEVQPLVVMSGSDSQVAEPSCTRIETANEWPEIWARHLGKSVDDAYRAQLELDFDRCTVVTLFLGPVVHTRGIRINDISETHDEIRVRFTRLTYQVVGEQSRFDQPYAIIALPKSAKSIVIEEGVRQYKGEEPTWKLYARLDVPPVD